MPAELLDRCRPIRLLLLDVDGVLTDGAITYTGEDNEIKTFHVRDGLGIKLWLEAGRSAAILSGRRSRVVERRAAELGITSVVQAAENKTPAFERLLKEHRLEPAAVCYMGDDLPDVPLLARAGLGIAVADACEEVKCAARFVTQTPGGKGAVREVVGMLLKAQGLWNEIVERLAGHA